MPSKRLYPNACDFEFCKLLKARGDYINKEKLLAEFFDIDLEEAEKGASGYFGFDKINEVLVRKMVIEHE